MSWHVFIGSVISKPKIRLLVYRGSFALICEPVYIQSLPNVHTEPCWLCAQEGARESEVALGYLGPKVVFPSMHLSSCSHAQKAAFRWKSLGMVGSSGSSVLSFPGLQVGAWLPLTHLCVT